MKEIDITCSNCGFPVERHLNISRTGHPWFWCPSPTGELPEPKFNELGDVVGFNKKYGTWKAKGT